MLLFVFVTFFLLRRGSIIFLRFPNRSCPPSPPRQTQLTSKNKKECWLEAASQSSSAIFNLSPACWRCGFPSPASLHTPFLSASLPTHAYIHAPHTHRMHALWFSKHTPPKIATCTRFPPSPSTHRRIPLLRLRTSSPHTPPREPLPSLLSRAGLERLAARPSPLLSFSGSEVPPRRAELTPPEHVTGQSDWAVASLLTSQETPGGVWHLPSSATGAFGQRRKRPLGRREPPRFPVLPNGVGGRGYWVRPEALPVPTEKNAHLVPKASLPFSFKGKVFGSEREK